LATIWIQIVIIYHSDDGNTYTAGVSGPNQAAGGFTAASAGSSINYPKPWRMRLVYGIYTGTGAAVARHKLPIATQGNALFLTGLNFTITYLTGAANFAVQGRRGEKRIAKV
jgi:hypothetical protein